MQTKQFQTQQGIFEAQIPTDVLGKGTYGMVYRVRSKNDPSIKKAIKTFVPETIDENEGVPATTLREVNAVKTIDHPNVMSVEEVVIPTNSSITEMFIVMELCRGTLKEKIQEMVVTHLKGDPKWVKPTAAMKLPAAYVTEAKLIAWQVLNAVAVCHSRGIMHRDLKPANILWSTDNLLKIGDFGLARFVRGNPISEDHLVPQTGEVQTMWYRAPEVLLGDERYGMLVDDWSLGCVIAELFRFRMSNANKRVEPDPLFAGRGDIHTLLLIFEALGTPHNEPYLKELPFWSNSFPKWSPGTLRQKLQLLDDVGFDLVMQLLKPSPQSRRAARFLLNHPWFSDVKQIVNTKFTPWYQGYENDYLRLLDIERLPSAKPLPPPGPKLATTTTTADSSASSNGGTTTAAGGAAKRRRERSASAKGRDQENRTTQNATSRRNASASSKASSASGQQPTLIQHKLNPTARNKVTTRKQNENEP